MTSPRASRPGGRPEWPALPLAQWQDTRDTLQLWLQIIGKIRLANTPLINHWWNVPLYVTSRGLTTSLMRHGNGTSFQIDLDFQEHRLDIVVAGGPAASIPLASRPVREFYREVMAALDEVGLTAAIWPTPVEIEEAIPFADDDLHGAYDPEYANRFWRALLAVVPVFTEFRSRFIGKASPVHLFWGALDLATTRFSGRPAPAYRKSTPNCGPHVMMEAYSHEVSSCGYWPGPDGEGYFYSYAYPVPPGLDAAVVSPAEGFWSADLAEFLLPYASVRTAANPEAVLMSFLQSTYDAVADSAGWDRARLERPTDLPLTLSMPTAEVPHG